MMDVAENRFQATLRINVTQFPKVRLRQLCKSD